MSEYPIKVVIVDKMIQLERAATLRLPPSEEAVLRTAGGYNTAGSHHCRHTHRINYVATAVS